jgi:hypothetical protein
MKHLKFLAVGLGLFIAGALLIALLFAGIVGFYTLLLSYPLNVFGSILSVVFLICCYNLGKDILNG